MVLGEKGIRDYLKQGNFRDLFVRQLGWDRYSEELRIELPPETYLLKGQAEKRGMGVFVCEPGSDGQIPKPAIRRKIEKQAAKSVHEHIIIYVDAPGTTQVWQWVKREAGKPDRPRENIFHAGQSGERVIQRLRAITFTLDEEATLGIVDVAGRVRSAFDVDKVTKRFYDRFKTEHDRFLGFIQGITEQGDREWYASLMLNRLMFVYFIQKKGFLGGDLDYLRNRLKIVQRRRGQDQFLSFYRYFLLRLFHEGLGQSHRSPELESLLGTVPYLNGGLFDVHQLEQQYADIEIADGAFERIFDFFDQYEWHLDTRPLRKDNEINPDVLGYIFEKYINQKQMGAYYTKEDITGYISKSTVIPFLFEDARKRCAIAFEPGGSVWLLLRDNSDRYIYESVRKGVDLPLPQNIDAGAHDVTKRQGWNRPAAPDYGLPTETWREHVARRERCHEVRKELASGQVSDINDLITYNLDIVQFAEDVVDDCEGPELLRAFYRAIEEVTILDPTCGSGAFLFAALNILEPLYDACLDRMQAFIDELDRTEEPHSPHKYKDFREILADVARHPNREYFILKSIILNNLYGVDIMEEAVEIAKLRLFLALVAQVESAHQVDPLPDIDFNIRAGNTLVGYARYTDAEASVTSKFDWDNAMVRIRERAEDIERLLAQFRMQQNQHGGEVTQADKQELRDRLAQLDQELDRYLATEYGVPRDAPDALEVWRLSHQPFHWFVEFHRIMRNGGFNVIIGNPPYVEYSQVRKLYTVVGYQTLKCGNLYVYLIERAGLLLGPSSRMGMIVPLGGFYTARTREYQELLARQFDMLHISFFSGDAHPSVLFEGVKYRLAIVLGRVGSSTPSSVFTSTYLHWYAEERPILFSKVFYARSPFERGRFRYWKSGSDMANAIGLRLLATGHPLGTFERKFAKGLIHYHRSPVSWIRAMDFEPYFHSATRNRSEDHLRDLHFEVQGQAVVTGAVLNSSLFFLWFDAQGNCRDVAGPDIEEFPVDGLLRSEQPDLHVAFSALMESLRANSRMRVYNYQDSGRVEYQEFYPRKSKQQIDAIDRLLAGCFGFTEQELDFIINYDIKYRMGPDGEA